MESCENTTVFRFQTKEIRSSKRQFVCISTATSGYTDDKVLQ